MSTWIALSKTLLLPAGILAILLTFRQTLLPFRSDVPVFKSKSSSPQNVKSKKAGVATSGRGDDSDITEVEPGASTVSGKSRDLQEQILLARKTPTLIADVVSLFTIIQVGLSFISLTSSRSF